jgi:hypothetical protein
MNLILIKKILKIINNWKIIISKLIILEFKLEKELRLNKL